jgi:dihydrolipoamide dehydrogenase
MENFDVIIIGGGPGGYVAAIRAAQLGKKTAIVEANHLGGICLNWGCIPTKALLRSSEVFHLIQHADSYGISVKEAKIDLKRIVERSRQVASQLSSGIAHLMKKNKVAVFDGFGKLNGKQTVKVTKEGKEIATLKAPHIILATGARARQLPGLETDGKLIWSYREAMVPDALPKSLLVVGSGAIGIEFASFYRTLGVEVTVVEVMDRILPVEDEEIAKLAHKQFEKQGMVIKAGTTVTALEKGKNNVTATLKAKDGKTSELKVDRVIMAVGIVANTEGLGLEATKVKLDRGHIITDEWMQTDEPGIYAIGDVAGAPWLAHKASHEGIVCVEKLSGLNHVHPIRKENIPGCTYCHPQIASVGLTEAKAKEAGYKVKVGRFPFLGNGKAIALGEPEGLVKTIFDEATGELIGAHMIGAEVTELVQGFVLGKTMEAVEQDFMHTIFPHPTLSEMMHESVLDAYGKVVHM